MLSVENPPSDSYLKTDDDDDKKIKTSCSNIEAVDLFNSDFDVNHHKFSIRDYVYSARSKDIATNWPFSEKNLQQCRKLGVTNLLPPFEHVDSVKYMSVKKCVLYDILPDQANESNPEGKTTSQFGQDEQVSVNGAACNQKLNSDHLHITSSVSDQGEREVPSEVEQFHSVKNSEAAILLEPLSKQVEAEILPVACKTDKISKLEPLVKLGTLAGPSTKEDNMTNNFIVSETTACKVCPVCKTFSSSSNTTLNAHIDQCLSGESTIKWKEEPKVIQHRIKPRKMRLMRDIYATALHCTLEDLDRRNGTNWASNSTPPDQLNELCVEESSERLPSAGIEETGHKEGEVYIDTDGTKVRILSKFSEAANIEENSSAQNILPGNKFVTDKKKKHQKILKLVTHGKPCSFSPHCSFETHRNLAVGQSGEKEVQLGQRSKVLEQIELDDSKIKRQWVGFKRTNLTKKTTLEDKLQISRHNLKGSLGERDRSSLLNCQQSFKNLVSSQTSKKIETSNNEPGVRLYREQPSLGRKREFPWSSEGVGFRKRSLILPKHKKFRKEGTSVHDSCNTATRATSSSNKEAPTKTSNSFVVSSKSSCSHQEFYSSSEDAKLTSARTKLTDQVIVPKFRSNIKRKGLIPTRFQFNSQLEISNNFAWRPSQNDDNHKLDSTEGFTYERFKMKENMVKMSRSRIRVLKNRGAIKFFRKEKAAEGLKNSTHEPLDYGHGVREKKELSPVNICSALEDSGDSFDDESESVKSLAFGENINTEKASKIAIGDFRSCGNSLVSESPKLPRSPEKSKSKQCSEVCQWDSHGYPTSPMNPILSDKQVSFSAEAVGNVMTGEFNYFSEVDPIPIPGPPGSFLRSPGHRGSADLQGSLLNTSQVQFTEDQLDFVDMDKSDSPLSAISDISNPTLVMSGTRSSKNFSVDPLSAQEEIQRGFIGAAQVSQAANLRAEQFNLDTSRINATSLLEKASASSKFEQLCCCSREEGTQGDAFNLQESQILGQKTMPLEPFPEMQMDNNCSERFGNLQSRSGAFSFSNYPNAGPGKVVYPTRIFASEHMDTNVYAEHEAKFLAQRDLGSPIRSASNPILRLMGKNLMVVNKDEVPSLQHRQHQSSFMNAQPRFQCSTVSEVSPCGVGNKDYHSYRQVIAQSPVVFSQDQRQDAYRHQYNGKLSSNFEGNVAVETPLSPYHASGVKFPSMDVAGAFKSPLGQHDHQDMLAEEGRPINRFINPLTYGLHKNAATSGVKSWGVDSTTSREIIVIDDATSNEADSAIGTMCHDGMGRVRVSSSRIAMNSIVGASKFSSRFTTPYYANSSEGAGSFYGGQPVMHNASFQIPDSEGINASPVKWNCNSEGLSFLHPSSLSSPSTSAGHLRPQYTTL